MASKCKPTPGKLSASIDFGKPGTSGIAASVCGVQFSIPNIPFPPAFSITGISFPPPFPIPKLNFSLSCDPSAPINISAGLAYGGGREACYDDNPDLQEAT